MPTMTRMHRHSSSNAAVEVETRGRRARDASVGVVGVGDANKENFGVHFVSSPFGNSSLIALQDLSNVHGKSPQRRSFSEGSSGPRHATPQLAALRCLPRAVGAVATNAGGLEDSQLSSSRMGDTTLDRMLDAIIESARKETYCKHRNVQNNNNLTEAVEEWSETSVHEMEVRTPTHLKRQRVVRRKNPHKINNNSTRQTALPTLMPSEHFIPSTKRCLNFSSSDLEDDKHHEEPFAKRGSMASTSSSTSTSTSTLSANSSSNTTEIEAQTQRGNIDLNINYNPQQQQLNVHVIRCRDLQRSHGSGSINAYVKVALAPASASTNSNMGGFQRTAVHRHSSRPYFDQHFSFSIPKISEHQQLQLAVWHRDRHLKRSEFLGCSIFPLSTLVHHQQQQQQNFNGYGSYKLQSQACLHSLPNTGTISSSTSNQPQQDKEKAKEEKQSPESSQPMATEMAATAATASQKIPNEVNTNVNDEIIGISIDSSMAAGKDDALMMPTKPDQPMVLSKKALHQRDADENLFLRFLELDPPADGNANNTTSSSGNPTTGGSGATPASATNANVSNANHMNGGSGSGRRYSTMTGGGGGGGGGGGVIVSKGRTPFTMTKRLTRTEERGFGFSIVWTHPPRVEKVEDGLSADRCGILPGDYVIFVDKHNVVTMPEADVLNLIRSQGSSLTLEIFRRSGSGANMATHHLAAEPTSQTQLSSEEQTTTTMTTTTTATTFQRSSAQSSLQQQQQHPSTRPQLINNLSRPATACSGTTSSIEAAKRRLHLPQVTFSKESIVPITDNRRRFLLQLISREQNFTAALHFGVERFVQPLVDRKDLISPNDHRTLFQNIDELLRIAEDILEQLCSNTSDQDQEPHMNFASRVYLSKTTAICAAYKKYCNGIKRADCVLVNKSRQTGSEFINFITEPSVPRKRPDLTMFIHRPLQHFREILKLMQLLASNCHVDTEEHKNFTTVISELQSAYREITVSSGLMEPLGEGRPLLTLQDLESRMVFTKCKPFTLAVQGRQWIFGGDLSRVEGRSIKPYWTLLFSDIIVFAKVSRDRVLFITEEPIPIANVVDSCFHMRKKTTEFRLTVDPNGRLAESPTGYCAPDLTRTPKRGARRKSLVLRAPSMELKAVWQNLLQRQIFLVNAALGSTPLSSPLDSPDVLNTLVPLSDIGMTSASMGSIKLPSLDSINLKQQQKQQRNAVQHHHQQQQQQQQHPCHQHGHGHGRAVEQIELLIDEKCRILNKTGTPKSSALHLANWMKGQLDKQQQQARLAAIARSQEEISAEDEQLIFNSDSEQDERITYWTRQQLEKRTKELNLAKENGGLSAKPNFGGKRLSGVEELSMSAASDMYSEADVATGSAGVASQISQSHSTTSDSQITVRSSPIVLDKLAVCRHCHKNCQQSGGGGGGAAGARTETGDSTPLLLCNSLKVQHSQSSPNRCCKLNGIATGLNETATAGPGETERGRGLRQGKGAHDEGSSVTSMSSSTITGELSSKIVASSSRRETGDTESDVAQLITDELSLSQSEATDDSVGAMPNSSSSDNKLHNLETVAPSPPMSQPSSQHPHSAPLANGHHCPPPPPVRRARPCPGVAQLSQEPVRSRQQVKAIVTIAETARVMRSSPANSPSKYAAAACNCRCNPEDFTHKQLSPDKMEHQTCKMLESPKQKTTTTTAGRAAGNPPQDDDDDEQLSLMLIGLAQFAPTAQLCRSQGQGQRAKPRLEDQLQKPENLDQDDKPPTIAVVPATPDAILTKTSTHVWDNSGGGGGGGAGAGTETRNGNGVTCTSTNQPRQAIIENIPEDSCDESPLEEEPPYRPMTSALRRFGTMSSLEKLPSDDRMDETEELDDDLDASYAVNGSIEQTAEPADTLEGLEKEREGELANGGNKENHAPDGATDFDPIQAGCSNSNGDVLASGAWTNRAGAFVSDKMSFFEESRAFIDKYLGRWNASEQQAANTSETDEQMDECTSGATSGEEVWGTPTSGGDNDNDDMQLINSENTHSSPTKSSTSLNDDDDTELMMDELLMAPPMTASTIRGLLPRRRLEPLFEEETESDEEKTQQDSDDVKKGEATTNGHYLEDLAGSLSDVHQEREPVDQRSRPRVQRDLEPLGLGTRPLVKSMLTTRLLPTTAITVQSPLPPVAVAASCEYLLEQRPSTAMTTTKTETPMPTTMITTMKTTTTTTATTTMTTTTTATTMMMKTTTMTTAMPPSLPPTTMPNSIQPAATPVPSSTTTTISRGSDTTSNVAKASGRPAKFIPPPPPPRRLLLTQTNLHPATGKQEPLRKSGDIADNCSSLAVDDADASVSVPIATVSRTITAAAAAAAVSTKISAMQPQPEHVQSLPTTMTTTSVEANANNVTKRPSSTIIETCLLGSVPKPGSVTSLATVSRIAKPIRTIPSQAAVGNRAAAVPPTQTQVTATTAPVQPHAGCGLSPRLEMRLALNHDILGDEDLICYEPGPDLTTILGHDLSTFHRLTGRDLLSRSATNTNRVQPKEAVISYSQQRNSKMDTPTVNRRPRPLSASLGQVGQSHSHSHGHSQSSSSHGSSPRGAGCSARVAGAPQHPLPNPNTWSNSAFADRDGEGSGNVDDNSIVSNYSYGGSKLGDLEILARREKIYSMSQSRSGCPVRGKSISMTTTSMTTTTTMAMAGTGTGMMMPSDSSLPSRAVAAVSLTRTMSTTSMDATTTATATTSTTTTMTEAHLEMEVGKSKRLINFIKRRNSEITASSSSSIQNYSDGNASGEQQSMAATQMSPRKDNDKPSLNRRLWKQITKRRRTNSVSQIVAG
ncbi:uncharacterized protein PsGEF isoform X2 [Drosophila tropicalis]|uniref:uncharacterized protein PsGEF isoform X2 n=1 Tax=Drosophila tropicalis TaxID=46794 RepID=UPI0035ABF042